MRAVVVRNPGGPEALEIVDVPVPTPGPGQVRIRVRAAGVNPVDGFVRSGGAAQIGMTPSRGSIGIGWDVAGVVEEVGAGVTELAPGDAVIGLSDRLNLPTSGYAEQIVLDTRAVAVAPRGLSPEQAATLPLNALTAVQALDLLDLDAGATVLVTGAAGAVGGYAVELAVIRGLRVVGTAAAADEELVRGFGAEWFVPREETDAGVALGQAVRALVPGGVDGVLDAAVLDMAAHDALRNGGSFVTVVAAATVFPLRGTTVRHQYVDADGRQLAELVAHAEAGRLTPRVAETFPLDKAVLAHQRFAEGGLRGRLVLVP
ncbi:NADP-dependent oxidoreductase [Pseudonocardia spinosispora]|uniref:NADP-dependent oxidoreductase n=1 Tax=Pseudonocardia spinosispora TaxID=103441 RepID=UPI00040D02CB|nr:NADP-dependent oxidoreductase [Pseudonocardia spinosispora]